MLANAIGSSGVKQNLITADRWTIYRRTNSGLANMVGLIDAPDANTAIAEAVKKFNIPAEELGRLLAQRLA